MLNSNSRKRQLDDSIESNKKVKLIKEPEYIYLAEKYDVNNNLIFKLGKHIGYSFDDFDESIDILFIMMVDNSDESELKILNALNKNDNIIKYPEIGYFICKDTNYIIKLIFTNI